LSLQLGGIILTILLSAYFAGSETAFLSFNKVRLQAWIKQKRWGVVTLNSLVQKPVRFLTTLLIGNNLVNVLYSSLLALYLTKYGFSEKFIFIFSPLLLLFFGETLPKSIARQTADRVITKSAVILQAFRYLLLPIVKVTEVITDRLQHRFNVSETDLDLLFNRTEITAVVRSAHMQGLLEPSKEKLLRQTLQLGFKHVSDIMTPRTSLVAIPIDTSVSDARNIFLESGFSRLPCYDGNVDNVVGVILAKDLLEKCTSLSMIRRDLITVPESVLAVRLPALFRKNRSNIAAVIDEYGGLAGIVTLEDVVEEVVGPILDEHDHNQPRCLEIQPNVWKIDGHVKLSHVNYSIGTELSSDHSSSIGGFVAELANKIPATDEVVKHHDIQIRVIRSDTRGVRQVELTTQNLKMPDIKP